MLLHSRFGCFEVVGVFGAPAVLSDLLFPPPVPPVPEPAGALETDVVVDVVPEDAPSRPEDDCAGPVVAPVLVLDPWMEF